LSEVVKTVDWLVKKGIRFVALKENIDLFGLPSTQSQAIATIFGALAEIERQWALQTTRKALTIAKRRGRGGGRPPALNTEQRQSAIKLYHDGKHSVKEICQIMGISRATFYRYLSFANAKLKATSLVRDDINLFELDS
jgi:DNA invertase Pin-like site-specific DNA recombinase